ncbi:MAG TPA: twin-arginine translocase TatA/TatE family subunit [Candidatus Hydrogenedentes bacterium]|nr:twin-arginine translocase TatA/TatE family subunit [Candidatus Hydrogenedentota bacterium]HOS02474.1 twin-arginine translocase TatA/TatE family subunit [Candidatus Hydrogenedentota bacterium]
MFNMDFPEFLLLAAVALIILGPEKFPQYARIAIKTYRDIRRYFEEAKREIADELNPVKHELARLSRHDPETYIQRLVESVTAAVDGDPKAPADPLREVAPPADDPYQNLPSSAAEDAEPPSRDDTSLPSS